MRKFKIGEKVQIRALDTGEWHECEIVEVFDNDLLDPVHDIMVQYYVKIPGFENPTDESGCWSAAEVDLRKTGEIVQFPGKKDE